MAPAPGVTFAVILTAVAAVTIAPVASVVTEPWRWFRPKFVFPAVIFVVDVRKRAAVVASPPDQLTAVVIDVVTRKSSPNIKEFAGIVAVVSVVAARVLRVRFSDHSPNSQAWPAAPVADMARRMPVPEVGSVVAKAVMFWAPGVTFVLRSAEKPVRAPVMVVAAPYRAWINVPDTFATSASMILATVASELMTSAPSRAVLARVVAAMRMSRPVTIFAAGVTFVVRSRRRPVIPPVASEAPRP